MKRFDVCSAVRFGGSGRDRLVLVLQHEALTDLSTVIAAPLFKPDELPPVPGLRPLITMDGQRWVVAMDRMASLPRRQLGKAAGNLEGDRDVFVRCIDLIFTGF
jgi:toxin CcdB